ncbi:uncharacterized protein ATC70_001408 [Mucor velutinosus]|uniref:Uncharacterized protein n=1 Tax=Mucor velutinosus TaxID=708070 RepID=A0AAN7DJ96_9FUNG|nr:hypothetical protein ATC70_001408 [Mucor velutinosus]
MNNLDTPLDAIKEAEASFAKLTMEDKLSHPPPDIVSLCTLNIKRLRLSNTMLLPTETAVLNDYQVRAEYVAINWNCSNFFNGLFSRYTAAKTTFRSRQASTKFVLLE